MTDLELIAAYLGAITAFLSVLIRLHNKTEKTQTAVTTGRVISHTIEKNPPRIVGTSYGTGKMIYSKIAYEVDGSLHHILSTGSSRKRHQTGEQVVVRYDPKKPRNASAASNTERRVTVWLGILLPLCSVGCVAYLIKSFLF
ncbi:MAG: DUF3592 domain-containing protein [Planctomycetota bacterium]